MDEGSEPKRVCRRSVLAFLGYAAAFGIVASSAVLTVSQAEPKPPRRPPHPRRRPQIRRSLARSGVRSGEAGELNDDRNDARDAQSGVRSGAPGETNDGTLATARPPPPPPSKKSNWSFWPTTAIGPPQRGPQEGRTARRQRRATGHPASRASAQAAVSDCSPDLCCTQARPNAGHNSSKV